MSTNWGNTDFGGVTRLAGGNLGNSAEEGASTGKTWRSRSDGTEGLIKGSAGNAQRGAHDGLASASVQHGNNVSQVALSWNKGEQAQGQTIDEHTSLGMKAVGESENITSAFQSRIQGN